MSRLGLIAIAALLAVPGVAAAQTDGGPQGAPRPNAAPEIPSGPQPFAADPSLGVPDRRAGRLPPPAAQDRRPPAASFDVIDAGSGQMRVCQRNGAVISCQ